LALEKDSVLVEATGSDEAGGGVYDEPKPETAAFGFEPPNGE
jgi:hypothetical protein